MHFNGYDNEAIDISTKMENQITQPRGNRFFLNFWRAKASITKPKAAQALNWPIIQPRQGLQIMKEIGPTLKNIYSANWKNDRQISLFAMVPTLKSICFTSSTN